jgi:hypothetical protein
LRIGWVHFDEFGHARIVGEQWLRGYPFNTLLFATFQHSRFYSNDSDN